MNPLLFPLLNRFDSVAFFNNGSRTTLKLNFEETTGPPGTSIDSPQWPLYTSIPLWILMIAVSIGTIVGNALVLVAYRLDRSIRKQINNRYIVSLAISDMIIGIEGYPFFTIYVTNGMFS